jgi:alpha-1,2-mannosyltransferase
MRARNVNRLPAVDAPTAQPSAEQTRYAQLVMFSWLLVPFFIVAAGVYLAGSTGLADPSGHAIGRDFINLYTAGRLLLEGRAEVVFNVREFYFVQREMLGPEFPLHLWSYPPHFLFLTAPLGLAHYFVALAFWTVLTTGLYAWAAGGPRTLPMLLLAAAPATLVNIAAGQTGALAAALFFGGLRLMHQRPIVSGVLFGLLTVKPQFGLLIPLVLLLERRWTVIASAVVTTAGLVALSVAAFGVDAWRGYLHQNFEVTRSYLEAGVGPFTAMAPSAFMALRLYGAEVGTAYAVQLACAVVVAVGVVVAWRSAARFEHKIALTGLAALLATPYAHNYDMTLVSVAVLVGYALERRSAVEGILLLLVWLLPIAVVPLHTVGIVIAPWVLLGFFGWLLWRSGREDQRLINA